MPELYPIVHVGPQRTFQSKHGERHAYDLMLAGEQEQVELVQFPTTPPPQVGQNLYGDIVTQYDRRKFKKAQQDQNGNPTAQNGSQGAVDGDSRQWSIIRQHSQEMALTAIEQLATFGLLEKPASSKAYMALVDETADWFHRNAEKPPRQTQAVKAQAEVDRVTEKFGDSEDAFVSTPFD